MKLILLALSCIAFALVVSACTETATPTNTSTNRAAAPTAPAAPSPSASVDEFATARANYQKNCEGCHGPEGLGGPVKVDNKQIKVPSLHAEHAKKHTDAEIVGFITNGHEEMPAFKDKLSAAEINDLVRFVRATFQKG